MIHTRREDQDNLQELPEAGTTSEDSKQQTNIYEIPVYFTVNNSQQQMLRTSADLTYSTVDEDTQRTVLQDNPAYLSVHDKSMS